MLFLPILWGMLPRVFEPKRATDAVLGPFLAKRTEFRKLEPRQLSVVIAAKHRGS